MIRSVLLLYCLPSAGALVRWYSSQFHAPPTDGLCGFYNGLMGSWLWISTWKLESRSFTLICNLPLPMEAQRCTHYTWSHFDCASWKCLCLTVQLKGCLREKGLMRVSQLISGSDKRLEDLMWWHNGLWLNVYGQLNVCKDWRDSWQTISKMDHFNGSK